MSILSMKIKAIILETINTYAKLHIFWLGSVLYRNEYLMSFTKIKIRDNQNFDMINCHVHVQI